MKYLSAYNRNNTLPKRQGIIFFSPGKKLLPIVSKHPVNLQSKQGNMRPRLYVENLLLLELAFLKATKMQGMRRALVKTRIMDGWTELDEHQAAWGLFAAAACPYSKYYKQVEWLNDRKADLNVNPEKDHPINHLAFLFVDQEARQKVKMIGFSKKGLINITFRSGAYAIYPKRTAKKITSQVHDFTFVPGEIFCSIADTVGLTQKKLA